MYPKLFLTREKDNVLLRKRHPWIFSNGLKPIRNVASGALVDVWNSDSSRFVGRGYYNSHSQIAVRILTRDQKETIDEHFFIKRFQELKAQRSRWIDEKQTNAYRVVFGESDGIPGLVIDRYNETYVLQIHTAGMEQLKEIVISAMKQVFQPKTIYERSDVNVRLKEGLENCPRGHIFGEVIKREIQIKENGIPLWVDIIHGQKTGLFLDQRENRKALQRYCAGKKVLNCFCYTGGFSVYAALAGAAATVNVDVSKDALATARRNFELNGLSLQNHEFIDADVFDYLDECMRKKSSFDIIILDPPAFVKNNKSLQKGLAGYMQINKMALQMLPKNGILVTSSCSAFVSDELFQDMLMKASSYAGCTLKALEIRHQPPDHPFNLDFPEGKYLKFWVCEKW